MEIDGYRTEPMVCSYLKEQKGGRNLDNVRNTAGMATGSDHKE